MSDIRQRIRQLVELANSTTSEGEASNAMSRAAALMAKHGIDARDLDDKPARTIVRGQSFEAGDKWHSHVCNAVADLCGIRFATNRKLGCRSFVGPAYLIEIAGDTYGFFCDQIELLYKQSLPRGLTKASRAEFRRTFKEAAAVKLRRRVADVVANLNKHKFIESGCTALAVIDERAAVEAELSAVMGAVRTTRVAIRPTDGSAAGWQAGELIDINRKVA